MENKFCYLKGIVACDSGRIQDCNNKRTATCLLEQKQALENTGTKEKKREVKKEHNKGSKAQAFCYLKGLVDCSVGRVQDCNIKRVEQCPLD